MESIKGFWNLSFLPLDSAIYYLSHFPSSFLFIFKDNMLIFVSMNIFYFISYKYNAGWPQVHVLLFIYDF